MIQPFVRCENPDCRHRGRFIPLPPSILPEKVLYRQDQPTDISGLNVVCRDCGQWRQYTRVEWGDFPWPEPEPEMARPSVWMLELYCTQPNCGTRTRWYVLDDSAMSANELGSFFVRATPILSCKNGHALVPAAPVRALQKIAEY